MKESTFKRYEEIHFQKKAQVNSYVQTLMTKKNYNETFINLDKFREEEKKQMI